MTMASLDLPGGEGPHSAENIDEHRYHAIGIELT